MLGESSKPEDPTMHNTTAPSPLVDLTRGNEIESLHYGHYVVATPNGSIVEGTGNIHFVTYPRSALKPIQAIQLITSGAADAYRLENTQLSLACSSHWAEPFHVEAVSAWLTNISCTEDDLICGRDYPYDEAAREALLRQNVDRSRIFHNCSGKHAGFLTTCRHLSYDMRGYDAFDHPSQVRYRDDLSLVTGVDSGNYSWGIDGCALPAPALPMIDVARAMARLASPEKLPAPEASAINRLSNAITAAPAYFWGTASPCTDLIKITQGRIIAKIGAEGYMAAMVRDAGLGISIKITDGTRRAVTVALFGVLKKMDLLTSAEQAALKHHMIPPVFNSRGTIVGELRPSLVTFN